MAISYFGQTVVGRKMIPKGSFSKYKRQTTEENQGIKLHKKRKCELKQLPLRIQKTVHFVNFEYSVEVAEIEWVKLHYKSH